MSGQTLKPKFYFHDLWHRHGSSKTGSESELYLLSGLCQGLGHTTTESKSLPKSTVAYSPLHPFISILNTLSPADSSTLKPISHAFTCNPFCCKADILSSLCACMSVCLCVYVSVFLCVCVHVFVLVRGGRFDGGCPLVALKLGSSMESSEKQFNIPGLRLSGPISSSSVPQKGAEVETHLGLGWFSPGSKTLSSSPALSLSSSLLQYTFLTPIF